MSFAFRVSSFEAAKIVSYRETQNPKLETSSESEVNDGTRNGNDFIS